MKVLTDNWKRLLAAAVALFAAMGMAACSKEEPPKKDPAEDDTITTDDGTTDAELDPWIGWPDFGEEGIDLPIDEWE